MSDNPLFAFIAAIEREILAPLVTLVALAAFLLFLWGVVEFIRAGAADSTKRSDGQRHMLWGIIGLAVLFSANAIVAFIRSAVGG